MRDICQRVLGITLRRQDVHHLRGPGTRAYYRSKFALVAFTFDLAAELANTVIIVNYLHPASLMNTHLVRQARVPPVSSIATGVRAVTNPMVSAQRRNPSGWIATTDSTVVMIRAVRSRIAEHINGSVDNYGA